MLGSSMSTVILCLLIASYISAENERTDSLEHEQKKNSTQEKRQNISKYIQDWWVPNSNKPPPSNDPPL